jgi:hypothetical protein
MNSPNPKVVTNLVSGHKKGRMLGGVVRDYVSNQHTHCQQLTDSLNVLEEQEVLLESEA